jgi:acetyl-CoA carboxylase biotin carboxyl carrier protein
MTDGGDKSPTTGGAMQVDKELIRELAALLEETGLGEIEVSDEGRAVRVVRRANAVASEVAPAPSGDAAAAAAAEDLAAHPGAVLSPMVGTAFVGPEPGAPPFVKVGDTVHAGATLLIVEAMKTMNPIPAPRDGRVTRILVSNGSPVEFGEVLMILE